jgi:hypothetical protein
MYRSEGSSRTRKTRVKHLLGKTAAELAKAIGDPFASYSYRDEEIFVYDKAPVKTIALQNGHVVKCDNLKESRKTVRVRPQAEIPIIVNGDSKTRGKVLDISMAAIAVSHAGRNVFIQGESVTLSFLLPMNGLKKFIELPCWVKSTRKADGQNVTVFILDPTKAINNRIILAKYVTRRRTEDDLDLTDNSNGNA